MIAIIDYDAGNLKSVEKALIRLGEEAVVSRERETILEADKVILPGVGSFGDAMGKLREFGSFTRSWKRERRFWGSVWGCSFSLREATRRRE